MRKPKQKRRLSKLREPEQAELSNINFTFAPEVDDDKEIFFEANPGPQTSFLSAPELEVLYGGAAGGGKSYAILADPVRDMSHPQFRGLLVRRTTEELRELVQKSQELYPKAIPGIKWSERKMEWITPSGGRLWMSYLERDQDVTRYQGQAFNYIAFDELTQWPTPFAWNYMRSRLRTTVPDLKLYMRATSNPGGLGHCVPFGDVLTSTGWKDIRDMRVGEFVLSVDKVGRLVEKPVSEVVSLPFKGQMISRKDQMVFTYNHRLPVKTLNGIEVRHFGDLPGQCNIVRAASEVGLNNLDKLFTVPDYKTRKTRLQQPDTITQEQFSELLGWFLSKGHTLDRDKEFGISQIKEPYRSQIRELLTDCGFNFREHKSGFAVSSPKWWAYFKQFGKCRGKCMPRSFFVEGNLHTFFKAIMAGDGCWVGDNSGTYYTISRQLADDISEVCVRLGYSCDLRSRQRSNRQGLSYEVHFTPRKTTELVTGNHIYNTNTVNTSINVTKDHFEGQVYCLTVPDTETFFIRQNGYVWLSGNTWVKKMFVDPAPWGESFWATDIETGDTLIYPKMFFNNKTRKLEPHPRGGEPLFKRRFIPASLYDNPYLTATGDYEANLLSLPEHERKRLLEGDWDVKEGAAFPEWNRAIHVVEPYDIPSNWRKFRSCDYGYGSFSAVLWFAVSPSDQLVVYRELYVSKVLAVDLADKIKELEREDGMVHYGVLDSSLWHQRGDTGPSLAEQMISRGTRWKPSDRSKGSRVSGKNEIHRRLQVDPYTEEPRLVFFDTCVHSIAQIPVLPLDPDNPEDVYTGSEDHIYDALRYGAMSRPKSGLFNFDGNNKKVFTPFDPIFGY